MSAVESSSGAVNDMASTMMHKFWDSALSLEPPEDYESNSDMSALMTSDGIEQGKFGYPSLGLGNSFAFKFEDLKGRVHRFNCGFENLDELLSAVLQRIGAASGGDRPQLLYEDDEHDKVLLATDGDLVSAITHARSAGLKVLRLHLDYSEIRQEEKTRTKERSSSSMMTPTSAGIMAGVVVLAGIGVLFYLKRSTSTTL